MLFAPEVEEKLWRVRGTLEGDPPRVVFVAMRPIDPERGIWACITAFTPTDPQYGVRSEED